MMYINNEHYFYTIDRQGIFSSLNEKITQIGNRHFLINRTVLFITNGY